MHHTGLLPKQHTCILILHKGERQGGRRKRIDEGGEGGKVGQRGGGGGEREMKEGRKRWERGSRRGVYMCKGSKGQDMITGLQFGDPAVASHLEGFS